ncbi:hypothetical protein ACFDTO_20645 [Microbacteriaceae bacterium 4G12]
MQKTRERRSSFTPINIGTASSARWNAFASECASWMVTRVENDVRARATTGEGRLLAIFDVLDSWLEGHDSEAATVVDAVVKLNERHPIGRVVSQETQRIRAIVIDFGSQAGLVDVEEFAESWHILLRGTAMRAVEGDTGAPIRARDMGRDLIARHRPRPVVVPLYPFELDSEFDWVEAAQTDTPRPSRVPDSDDVTFEWFDAYGWDGYLATPGTYA